MSIGNEGEASVSGLELRCDFASVVLRRLYLLVRSVTPPLSGVVAGKWTTAIPISGRIATSCSSPASVVHDIPDGAGAA